MVKHFWVENRPGPRLVSAAGKAFGVEMGNGIQHRAFLLRDFVLRAPGEEQGMGDGGDGSTEGDACWVFCRILGPACGNGILGVLPDPEAVPFCFYFVRLGSNQGCPGRWRRRSPALRNEDLTRGGGGEFLAGEQQGRELLEELEGFR